MSGSGGALVERFRAARRDPSLAVLEGLHALKHAIRFGADILEAWTRDAPALHAMAGELAPDVAAAIESCARPVELDVFDRLAPSPHPTGVIALARRPPMDVPALLDGGGDGDAAPVVLLDRPTHHGNIGAVVRVAAAAGAAGVLVTGEHDPWHPASIRGGAGLQFALPVAGIDSLPATPRAIVALDPSGDPLGAGAAALPPGSVLVFGSERSGVSEGLLERSARTVAIPMRPGVSSLNLATAVAVALYVTRHP